MPKLRIDSMTDTQLRTDPQLISEFKEAMAVLLSRDGRVHWFDTLKYLVWITEGSRYSCNSMIHPVDKVPSCILPQEIEGEFRSLHGVRSLRQRVPVEDFQFHLERLRMQMYNRTKNTYSALGDRDRRALTTLRKYILKVFPRIFKSKFYGVKYIKILHTNTLTGIYTYELRKLQSSTRGLEGIRVLRYRRKKEDDGRTALVDYLKNYLETTPQSYHVVLIT